MWLSAIVATTTDDIEVPLWPWGLLIIAVGLYVVAVAALIAAGRREDARALAGFVPDCAVMVGRLARDRRISRPRRAILWLVLAYLLLGDIGLTLASFLLLFNAGTHAEVT